MKEKKRYEQPQVEVIEFCPTDSIATSNGIALFEQICGGGDDV